VIHSALLIHFIIFWTVKESLEIRRYETKKYDFEL
jgi:hypothetical protein